MSKSASESNVDSVDQNAVGGKARNGAVWSALQIGIRNIVSVGSTAVLARLLSPGDYGLMGMVATLTALLQVFSDMGLSWATVQRRLLTEAQLSNLFWANVAAGSVLWGICVLVSPLVARFYGQEELVAVTAILGMSFFLGGLSVQPFALMRRRMEFRKIAIIEVSAIAFAVPVAIGMASAGMGYWALLGQALTAQLVRAVLALPKSRIKVMRPKFGVGTTDLIHFGGILALNGLLIYASRTMDSVLIGRFLGPDELGFYDRAYFLMLLPSVVSTGVLASLMVPSLSALRGNPTRFGDAYRRAVRLVAFVGCPMAVGLALTSSEFVRLIYGEKWMAVAPLLVWLSVAGITQPIYNTTGWLFTASGKAVEYLNLTLMNALVLVSTFAVCVGYGSRVVAMGYGLVMGIVLIWPALWMAHRYSDIKMSETLRVLGPVAVACFVMAVAVVGVGAVASGLSLGWMGVLSAKIVAGVVTYLVVSRFLLFDMFKDDLLPMLPAGVAGLFSRFLLGKVP